MPDFINRHQTRAKFVLSLLEKKPLGLRRKDIKTDFLIQRFPESTFHSVFYWLRANGYIEKTDSEKHMAPYVITDAGKLYLDGLKAGRVR